MFSVLIPVYNHRSFLLDAVLSACRSHLVSEVLLVDDGSTDGSRELIEQCIVHLDPRVRWLPTPAGENHGAHARLNQLAAAAQCDWLAVLNSDDCFAPGRFELIARSLKRQDWEFISGHIAIINGSGRGIGSKRGPLTPEFQFPPQLDLAALLGAQDLLPLLVCQNFIATTSNMVFTKALYERVGGFADYRYAHDWAFALGAVIQGVAVYLPQFLTVYRSHGSNTIKENQAAIGDEVRLIFDHLRQKHGDVLARPDVMAGLVGNHYLGAE